MWIVQKLFDGHIYEINVVCSGIFRVFFLKLKWTFYLFSHVGNKSFLKRYVFFVCVCVEYAIALNFNKIYSTKRFGYTWEFLSILFVSFSFFFIPWFHSITIGTIACSFEWKAHVLNRFQYTLMHILCAHW